MTEKTNVITIDGPSGVGKSTVSRKVASATGFTYLDTGAMYRAVGFYLTQKQISLTDSPAIASALREITLDLSPAADEAADVGVILNGRDISGEIRTPEMAMIASAVSALPEVRQHLTALQRAFGDKGKVVAEGRDTGTVVFPNAAYKFYLDAAPEIRAERRCRQLQAKGMEADFQEMLRMTLERDKNDSTRDLAPLTKAEDAVLVDTSKLSVEEVVRAILSAMK